MDNKEQYLELLKKSLTGSLDIYFTDNWSNISENVIKKGHYTLSPPGSVLTMVGRKKLDSIQKIIKNMITNNISGDILIAGCWRGGLAIFVKACIAVYEPEGNRNIWCADAFINQKLTTSSLLMGKCLSFFEKVLPLKLKFYIVNRYFLKMGFPTGIFSKSDLDKVFQAAKNMPWFPQPVGNTYGVTDILTAFERYQLFDDSIKILKGWFSDTLKDSPIQNLALIYADGDMYHSTLDILNNTYTHVVDGGIVIIDDYGAFEDCKNAVDNFRSNNNILSPLSFLDDDTCLWIKSN